MTFNCISKYKFSIESDRQLRPVLYYQSAYNPWENTITESIK